MRGIGTNVTTRLVKPRPKPLKGRGDEYWLLYEHAHARLCTPVCDETESRRWNSFRMGFSLNTGSFAEIQLVNSGSIDVGNIVYGNRGT